MLTAAQRQNTRRRSNWDAVAGASDGTARRTATHTTESAAQIRFVRGNSLRYARARRDLVRGGARRPARKVQGVCGIHKRVRARQVGRSKAHGNRAQERTETA